MTDSETTEEAPHTADGDSRLPDEDLRLPDERADHVDHDPDVLADEVAGLTADLEELTADVEALSTDVKALSTDIEGVTADVDEKIEDLRERLVKLYRDVQRKASVDHGHPELADAIAELEAELAERDERFAATDEKVSDLTAGVEEARTEREELSGKLSKVANAAVRIQRRLDPIERYVADRRRLAELTAEANRSGVKSADCEACGDTVRLSLLSTPACPHCNRQFRSLDPNTGFFGRSTLLVGDPPAIEGDVAANEAEEAVDPGEGAER